MDVVSLHLEDFTHISRLDYALELHEPWARPQDEIGADELSAVLLSPQ